jgi:hypothetical protein
MAIQRIHFRERYALPRDEAGIVRAIGGLLVGNTFDPDIVEPTFLETGVHDLTPPVWQRYRSNNYAQVVQVLDNGAGFFMRVPNSPAAIASVMRDGFSANVPGLEVYPLDTPNSYATVMGDDPETPPSPQVLAYLFDLVAYREIAPSTPDAAPIEAN